MTHDSTAVLSCAKLWSDHSLRMWVRAKRNFPSNLITKLVSQIDPIVLCILNIITTYFLRFIIWTNWKFTISEIDVVWGMEEWNILNLEMVCICFAIYMSYKLWNSAIPLRSCEIISEYKVQFTREISPNRRNLCKDNNVQCYVCDKLSLQKKTNVVYCVTEILWLYEHAFVFVWENRYS